MTNYSAQGSITIKRLRSGDSLFITLEGNGKPLYQGVDPVNGKPSPDWSDEVNQPMLTPKVTSTRGNAVTLSSHKWKYNGDVINFDSAAIVNGWKTDATKRFKMNAETGALRIIANLASKTNIANDSLIYSCIATVAGIEYNLQKSVDIAIQPIGASSYYGTILATTEQLTAEVVTTKITTNLYLSAEAVKEYHVKWFKDDQEWPEQVGQKSITIGRDDVNGTQLFIAEFYKTAEDATPIFRAGIRIIDTLDQFVVVCAITSTNKEVDEGSDVTVTSKIVNTRTNTVISPASATWRSDVMDKKSWSVLKTAASNVITITTKETDNGGEQNDVEVVAEVTWN